MSGSTISHGHTFTLRSMAAKKKAVKRPAKKAAAKRPAKKRAAKRK